MLTPPVHSVARPQNDAAPAPGSWRLPWIMIALTVIVFGGAIVTVSHYLRQKIQSQILSRDGEILHSLVLMQQYDLDTNDPLVAPFEHPATQFELLLKTSRLLKGALAARLFDATGQLVRPFPDDVAHTNLAPALVDSLRSLKPVSRFNPKGRLADIFDLGDSERDWAGTELPLLEVNVPLHLRDSRSMAGIAQFVVTGDTIAEQFAALDAYLYRQAGIIFLTGSLLIGFGLHRAFRKLQRSNQLLAERSRELVKANQELLLASKTSAIGAVAAHLIHGLKNPLFGLKNLANECVQNPSGRPDPSWQCAAATADHMQNLINSVVRVLQDENHFVDCHISLEDLVEIAQTKFGELAEKAGVDLEVHCRAHGQLPYRAANLVLLILQNLVENALQATPRGKQVRLHVLQRGPEIVCEVRDEGRGIPEDLQKVLFTPCRSSKPQSSGIGLAISKQLANHLGAGLELKESTSQGTRFALTLPGALVAQNDAAFAA